MRTNGIKINKKKKENLKKLRKLIDLWMKMRDKNKDNMNIETWYWNVISNAKIKP